jgi:vacuolar-type H+-ATPase subunit E/Vma4
MEVSGNLELLKREIQRSYTEKLDSFEKECMLTFNETKKKIEEEHDKALLEIKKDLQNEEKNVFKATLSEEKLNAKKEFENKREEVIAQVFAEAEERSREVLLSKEYIDAVKAATKEKESVEFIGGFEEYKKSFPAIKIDKKTDGIVVKDIVNVIDFTFSAFAESKKLELRHRISNLLFEDVS